MRADAYGATGLRGSYAAHRNITGDSSRYFAAVLKGEHTFAFEPALELSQNTQKSRIKTTVRVNSGA